MALLEEKQRRLTYNKLKRYKPYSKQADFHAAGAKFRERLLIAGNQLGKCCTAATLLDLPSGERISYGDLYARGSAFDVLAWNGSKVIVTKAVKPIKKPAEPCVRLWLSDGRWIETALQHRMLANNGDYVFSESLLASLQNLRVSNSEYVQLAHALNVQNLKKITANFLHGCLEGFRLCDVQLHRALNNVAISLPLLNGAQVHNYHSCDKGGYLTKHTSSLCLNGDLPANPGAFPLILARCAEFLSQAARGAVQSMIRCNQALQRLHVGLIVQLRSCTSKVQRQRLISSLASPINGNQIVAYELITSKELYDFTVPETSNYINAGLVHHNTWSAGFETAMHLTGRYPDNWQGRVFNKPVSGWAAGVTSEVTRDTVQRILMGRSNAIGSGSIPLDAIYDKSLKRGVSDAFDTVIVRHGGGGDVQAEQSLLGFKSYDQGREKFQGETLDFVWLDEESDEDIYTESLTRTNATGGFLYMTFTPLKGMTNVVKRFLIDKPAGTHVTTMTIEDAEHYTPEQRLAIIASYPAHEREARTKGVPSLGSGRIFPLTEESIKVEPFEIPPHWVQICGIDFGWDHPSAAARLAWDRDNDVIYVTAAHRQKEQTPVLFAATVKPWGAWLPWAWPHDGLQHDKGSGIALAEQYRAQGLAILDDKATHPPQPNEPEGSGGNGVEAGVMELLDRMQTGRLKVFSHLNDWFEEFRMYHRDNGKIVKKDDDLLSATRYAYMMRRFACVKPTGKVLNINTDWIL
jgi:phage terminase large subunit-like protein